MCVTAAHPGSPVIRVLPSGPLRSDVLASLVAGVSLALFCCLPFVVPTAPEPIPSFDAEWLAAALGLVAIAVTALAAPDRLRHWPRSACIFLAFAVLIVGQTMAGDDSPSAAGRAGVSVSPLGGRPRMAGCRGARSRRRRQDHRHRRHGHRDRRVRRFRGCAIPDVRDPRRSAVPDTAHGWSAPRGQPRPAEPPGAPDALGPREPRARGSAPAGRPRACPSRGAPRDRARGLRIPRGHPRGDRPRRGRLGKRGRSSLRWRPAGYGSAWCSPPSRSWRRWVWPRYTRSPTPAGVRFTEAAARADQRPTLWRGALEVFAEAPLAGAGHGRFAGRLFEIAPDLPTPRPDVMTTHAHNLVLQIAAEYGLVGPRDPGSGVAVAWGCRSPGPRF